MAWGPYVINGQSYSNTNFDGWAYAAEATGLPALMEDLVAVAANIAATVAAGAIMVSPLQAVSGTVGAPGITFGGDTDNGLYRTGANAWSLACAGAQAVGIAATVISIPYTTPSTSSTTGAITVASAGIAGDLFVGGKIASNIWGSPQFDTSGSVTLVAGGGSAVLATGACKIWIAEQTNTGSVAEFICGYNNSAVMGDQTQAGMWSVTTTPAANKLGVAYDGSGNIKVYNGFAGPANFSVAVFKFSV